nr:immunoglobulin heavy chain junction region [Macaca mulatta]MOW19748.1 immunoglobulin heavy chain junction region [Macaca mulatta]MOW19808.1 immunoglobulin heavy chain junction region [Macaca mulatta]MOW20344.1 immunoglobulin heavy chain junction region [Macaca mulatta]MOW21010.1 immunoglobulin heavy chain junction region [Macaca mulatta]
CARLASSGWTHPYFDYW